MVRREQGTWACFHARGTGSLPTVHQTWPVRFHPLDGCRLFRAPSLPRPPDLFRDGLAARVSALLATSPVRVHHSRGFQPSLRSVPRRSQPLDGFLRAPAPRLVSSSSRVQGVFSVQGLLPSRSASPLVEGCCPLAVAAAPLTRPSREESPRNDASASRLLSTRRSVPSGPVIRPRRRPLPSSGSSPPGPLPLGISTGSPAPSARGVFGFGLRLRARRDPSPSASTLRGASRFRLRNRPPAREFRA